MAWYSGKRRPVRSSSHTMSIRTLPPGSNISYKPSREIDHDYRIELGGSWESRSLGQWVCVYVCMVCFSGLALVCSIRHSVSLVVFGLVCGDANRGGHYHHTQHHPTPPPKKEPLPKKNIGRGKVFVFILNKEGKQTREEKN